ncbi:MAG: LysR substrate-binding domain-containing protein [Deltaproteobacteria bacterium]
MKDLPLNALRVFAVIRGERGVRAAARLLGVSHSAVSRHLAELEAWLGVPLVRAGGGRRGLTFTPRGEALGDAVVAGLRAIEAAVEEVREDRSPRSVLVSTTPSVAVRWLLPRLPRFTRAYPAVELSVVVEQRVEDLEANGVDLAIRMGRGPWREAEVTALMDETLFPVASPSFLAAHGRLRRNDDLLHARLLHDREPNTAWDVWRRVHGPRALEVRRGPRFASSDMVLRAAAQGQGVALARARLVADDLASGVLVRPLADLSIELGTAYWLIRPPREPRTPAVAQVIAWLLREGLGEHPAA